MYNLFIIYRAFYFATLNVHLTDVMSILYGECYCNITEYHHTWFSLSSENIYFSLSLISIHINTTSKTVPYANHTTDFNNLLVFSKHHIYQIICCTRIRNLESTSYCRIQNPQPWIQNQQVRVWNPQPRIQYPQAGIWNL